MDVILDHSTDTSTVILDGVRMSFESTKDAKEVFYRLIDVRNELARCERIIARLRQVVCDDH